MRAWRVASDAVAMAALTLVALAPAYPAFATADFWVAAVIGVALGTAIAVVGALLRWHVLVVAAVAVVAYFVFGSVAALRDTAPFGAAPTLDGLATLAVGVVHAWKQVLTLPDPLDGFDRLLVAPYLAALVASVLAASLALRARRFGLALLPIGALLVGSVAFSTYQGFHPALVGALLAGGALAWGAWRARLARAGDTSEEATDAASRARRAGIAVVGAGLVLVVATAAGGSAALAASGSSRAVLRDTIVPPLELHDYATPLTQFRTWVTDGEDAELFTVSGVPADTRIRLATLDLYDGTVYEVSGSGGAGSGVFSRVGRTIDPGTTGAEAHVTVAVGDLSGVWAPTVGYLESIRFAGDDAGRHDDALHYNAATGTAVVTTGLTTGDEYSFDAVIPPDASPEALTDAKVAAITTPAPDAVPEQISAIVEKAVGTAAKPYEQVAALASYFSTTGFFSHGLEGQVASRSGHGLSRQTELLAGEQMVGDAEQYAVAMALAVSQLGLPVRVVMGFEAAAGQTPTVITGDDVTAWVEVPFQGAGWVAFDPTPPEDQVPQQQTPQQAQKPRVQVAQPPDSPQEPAELPPAPPVEEAASNEQPADLSWLWATLRWTGVGVAILALLLGPSLVLAIVRGRRRRSRLRAEGTVARVDGGWAELVDCAVDVGTALPPTATRREQGVALDGAFPGSGVAVLATRADIAVFGAGAPTADDARAYWADVETARRRMEQAVPWHRRLRAALFPASLLRRSRPAAGGRRS
ncbi:transglutaminase-like domain-containing protein [Microbacterium sp. BWT-B31]|uniref:transglutaminase-like domain-containing protein n=1 Tax=Microbacterium sp. BWT-B31 TaxID=3232072 RepID=UPI00352973D9